MPAVELLEPSTKFPLTLTPRAIRYPRATASRHCVL
jgi:hypothetical protein